MENAATKRGDATEHASTEQANCAARREISGRQRYTRAYATCCYRTRLARPSSDFHSLISARALARFRDGLTLFKMGALGGKLVLAALALAGGSLTAFATDTTRARSCAVIERSAREATSSEISANLSLSTRTVSPYSHPESLNGVGALAAGSPQTPALRTSLHTSRPDQRETNPTRGLVEPWQARQGKIARTRTARAQFSTREVIDPWATTAR